MQSIPFNNSLFIDKTIKQNVLFVYFADGLNTKRTKNKQIKLWQINFLMFCQQKQKKNKKQNKQTNRNYWKY